MQNLQYNFADFFVGCNSISRGIKPRVCELFYE